MMYIQSENSLTFSNQTHLRPDDNVFKLHTTTSHDVDARYTISTGEKKAQESIEYDPDKNREKVLYITNKTAKVLIRSKKKESIDVCLKITISGTIVPLTMTNDENSGQFKIVELSNNGHQNPTNVLIWDIKVLANETKELEFQYMVENWEVTSKKLKESRWERIGI